MVVRHVVDRPDEAVAKEVIEGKMAVVEKEKAKGSAKTATDPNRQTILLHSTTPS